MADENYDVFANLYDNKEDEKKAFLATLKTDYGDTDSDDVSIDELLPPKKTSGKGGKSQSKPPPKVKKGAKMKVVEKPTENEENLGPVQDPPVTDAPAISRRVTRSSSGSNEVAARAPPAAPTTQTSTHARGRKGRRGTTRTAVVAAAYTAALELITAVASTSTVNPQNSAPIQPSISRSSREVMRARRNYLSELASRSTNVDFVDLVSAPMHPIPGVINVDSDDEDQVEKTASTNNKEMLELSFDEDNPELSIKIKWNNGNAEIFKLRKHQKFLPIFQQFAEREGANVENVVFNIDSRIITVNDTPDSINYKVYEFITGRVLSTMLKSDLEIRKRDPDMITINVQSDLWRKRVLKIELKKSDKLNVLYIKCAEELNVATNAIKLSFDGEVIKPDASLTEMEFEGGEMVDLAMKEND